MAASRLTYLCLHVGSSSGFDPLPTVRQFNATLTSHHWCSVYASSANLLAEYIPQNGGPGTSPAKELMLIIVPLRCRRMVGSTALTVLIVPNKFVSNCALASSIVTSSTAPPNI